VASVSLWCAVLLLLALPAFAGTFTTYNAIEYTRAGNQPMLLDLRVPDGAGRWPVIVYLHSGAWITGDRSGGPAIREAERDYAVVSIDYPLAPQNIWPSQLDASKAAVRWVRANADLYHLDPNRIAAFGTSAGGHLAAMLGTDGDSSDSRVQAVVDLYGPVDLLKIDEEKLPCYGSLSANSPFMPPSLLMGCPIQECAAKTATSNPMNYITPDDPPFLILQGMQDCLVPWQQSRDLDAALRAGGVSSQLYLLPTAEHADDQFDEPQWEKVIDDFLDARLRGVPIGRRRAVAH
jgi:acetyl esterase/lipase